MEKEGDLTKALWVSADIKLDAGVTESI